jgi:putative transcriptional regulator
MRKGMWIKACMVAEKLHIIRMQFSNIENGKCEVDILEIEKLRKFMKRVLMKLNQHER